ncbi:hypothetical protein K2O51_14615 [Cupriavidus pinatubonensis]|uniref:hypothetical protein n=1 Tax=Cupriavidus pinatubonensis TaxID=248026 RepID=UPI001C734EFD|nr:hypothetical protein [Cupriavidus pinatubonensis]QYY32037.1 hypothetical protein K2O51_14615 [Cupriavidus pinatubonensis]
MTNSQEPERTARDWPRRGTAVCYGYFVILVLPVLPTAAAVREENGKLPAAGERLAATGSNS